MFNLTVVEGKQRGQRVDLKSYPFVIGKNSEAHLKFSEPGVWDNHIAIELSQGKGPELRRLGDGVVSLNSEPIDLSCLRNGDLISFGAVVLRFGLSPVKRKPLSFLNSASWMAIILVGLIELLLMVYLKSR